ncbi:MAG: sugar kinase [[Clostridium] cellulosi]|nr:MAG: 2-dehydro-3-deoxygluconokinase [[Clostridium] cellulosi]
MGKIVTFGEIMMRLQAPSYQRIMQASSFTAYFGGSEANTAAALAQWGKDSVYVTKLPKNPLGESCIRNLKYWGIDTSKIVRGNGRLGVYYTEKGASQRPPQVVYDRKYSDFSLSGLDDYDFEDIFKGAEWFHFSGITPALGGNLPEITKRAVEAAKKAGVRISCDFNYRSKLWSVEEACKVMTDLITGIDVLIINENQAKEIFGIESDELDEIASVLANKFNVGSVAITKRRTISGEVNEFSAMLFKDGKGYYSRTYSIFMIDKIGGGDAFSAGLIYGLTSGKSCQETIDFAAASACSKHTIEGDMLAASVEDIEWIARSDGRGRMVR